MLGEGNWLGREINEDVAVPDFGGDPIKRIVSLTKTTYFFHVRRPQQRAIQLVGPGVVSTLNAAVECACLFLAQQGATMPADIMKSSDATLIVTHNDDAGIGNAPEKIVARIRNLLRASGTQPHIEVDGLYLVLKMIRIRVVSLRKRRCLRDSDFRPGICVGSRHD